MSHSQLVLRLLCCVSAKYWSQQCSENLCRPFLSNQILGIRMHIFASHQCADYVCASYASAGEARVTCVMLLQKKLFGVCSIQAVTALATSSSPTSISIAKEHRWLHLSESSISECVRLCDAHMAYTWVGCMYVTTFHVTFLSMTNHIIK